MKVSCLITIGFLLMVGAAAADQLGTGRDATTSLKYNISGTVTDEKSGKPINGATVQVIDYQMAMPTNADGRYRLVLPSGSYVVRVSHVGHKSSEFTILLADSSRVMDISLRPLVIDLGVRTVHTTGYNPADKILDEAIARKKDILGQFHDYSYESHAKFIVRDGNQPDSQAIRLIVESQTISYWENPDKYKEIVRARKQSANMSGTESILIVGEMLNFNRNRLEIGDYSVVTPTANDAREYYDYRLTDTAYYDERPAFVLEFTPRNEYAPLLEGEVHILDSTYEVARIEGRFTKGVNFTGIKNIHYYQQLAAIAGEHWLPVQIGLTADAELKFPGLPSLMKLEFVASIYSYQIDEGIPAGTFDEYVIEVDEKANDMDSVTWSAMARLPLTEQEIYGYRRIDSLESNKPLGKKLLRGLLLPVILIFGDTHDFFHYNRVEGAYAGLRLNFKRLLHHTEFDLKGGYAFKDYHWQYRLGFRRYLWPKQKLWLSVHITDQIVHRPTVVSGEQSDATFYALFFKKDPFDYYREKGYELQAGVRLFRYFSLEGGYHDYDQYAKRKKVNYAFFNDDQIPRENVRMREGNLRAFRGALVFDSRKRARYGRDEYYVMFRRLTRLEIGVEYASPDLIDNDFNYRRYYFQWQGRYRLPRLGIFSLFGYLGGSEKELPPQRLFVVDYHDPYMVSRRGMNTSGDNNFGGDRVALIYGQLDLGPYLFRNSGISLLKGLPFGLDIHGGAMWTEFHNSSADLSLMTAEKAYTEAGFGINYLTPFLAPFNISLEFTWQLSDYDTNRFEFGFDIDM